MVLKLIFVFACIVVGAIAAPVNDLDRNAKAVLYHYETMPDGSYVFSFTTNNSLFRYETGTIKYTEDKTPYVAVRGMYAFKDNDGKSRMYSYTSDLNGYRQEILVASEAAGSSGGLTPGMLASLVGGGLG